MGRDYTAEITEGKGVFLMEVALRGPSGPRSAALLRQDARNAFRWKVPRLRREYLGKAQIMVRKKFDARCVFGRREG
jgi:hypothetical protein